MSAARGAGEALRSDGLVLRLTPYRESDLVVTLFTRDLGKLGALARGARRSQRRFGGALQPFVAIDVALRLRPGAELAELTEAAPRRAFARLGADPHRLGRAGYLCELCEVLSRERDPAPPVLDLLAQALALLEDDATSPTALLRGFEVRLLDLLGLWPDPRRCARCGAGLDAGLHEATGCDGWLCGACGEQRLTDELASWLTPQDLELRARQPIARAVALELGRRTLGVVRGLSGRPLRSVAFLRQLGDAGEPGADQPPGR